MKLRGYHVNFCREVVETNNPMGAYKKFYKWKNNNVAGAGASRLMKDPAILALITQLKQEKEELYQQARKEELVKMKDQIISEVELDKFHTDVLHNQIKVEEHVVMREFIPAHFKGKVQIPGKWISSIKKIERLPNIREKQTSAEQLFKRKGSFAPIKVKADVEVFDNKDVQRMLRLSNGELIPIPT